MPKTYKSQVQAVITEWFSDTVTDCPKVFFENETKNGLHVIKNKQTFIIRYTAGVDYACVYLDPETRLLRLEIAKGDKTSKRKLKPSEKKELALHTSRNSLIRWFENCLA